MELEYDGRRYPVAEGELIIGADPSAAVVLAGARPRHAVVRALGERMATIRATEAGADVAVNGVAFVGTLSGQLFFGWLGDRVGRKSVYGMTLLTMIVCSVASGLSFGHSPACVMATLCFFRFWLGFGIGGDYPLSATIMSE